MILHLSVDAELCEDDEEPPVEICEDSSANNTGDPLPCAYDPEPIDFCPNIDDIQDAVPDGYIIENGNCVLEEQEPILCDDEDASNYGEEGECIIIDPIAVCEIGTELIMNGGFEYPVVTENNGQWQIFTTGFDRIAERLSNNASELELHA